MRTRTIIGAVLFVAGLAIAIGTCDDSPNELAWRLAGLAMLLSGAFIGDFFETYEGKKK